MEQSVSTMGSIISNLIFVVSGSGALLISQATQTGVKVGVKSAAYTQTWQQKRYSVITFNIPKTRGWDPATNTHSMEVKRHADVYIFALLGHKDQKTINPMNLEQWAFYVVPTSALNERKRSQTSITLTSLEKEFEKPVSYFELESAVNNANES